MQARSFQSEWEPYSLQKVQAAVSARKPVIIDFSAEWCPGCHVLDQTVFSDPQILAKLEQLTPLRVDATDMYSPQVQTLLDKYEVIGLPTVVFLDAKGEEIKKARIEGAGPIEQFNQSLQWLAQENHITFKEKK